MTKKLSLQNAVLEKNNYRKSEIQGGPKVGIQYIHSVYLYNYCVTTFSPPCMSTLTSCMFSTVICKTFLCPFYFEDVINSPRCIVSNGRVMGEQLIENDLEVSLI
jgi:hypothetical protein